MIGRTSSTPMRVAMAPTVERIRKPSPTPSTATTVRYRVAPNTARTASGWAREIPCEPSRAWPPTKVTSTVTRATAKVTAASTPALAASTGNRRGTAAKVALIIPVAYSPVTASTPSTPTVSSARLTPMRSWLTGLKSARSPAFMLYQWALLTYDTSRPTMAMPSTVAASTHHDDRTVRSLIHSERITWPWVTGWVIAGSFPG